MYNSLIIYIYYTNLKPAGMPRHWWWWLIRLCWILAWETQGIQRITTTRPSRPLGRILAILPFGGYRKHMKTHEKTLRIRPPWHLVCLVVSVVRFSFHHGAMKYCDRKLKSRVHAISNRRMTWPRNRGSKWNGCIPGERDSKPFLLALEDEMFKKSTNAIRSYHANAMCVLNPEQNEWVAVYVSVSSGFFRCLRKCEGKTFWDLSKAGCWHRSDSCEKDKATEAIHWNPKVVES